MALILAIPLVGFDTVDVNGGVGIQTRFSWVAIAVAAVFFGRIGIGFLPRLPRIGAAPRLAALTSSHATLYGWCGLGLAAAWPFLPFSSRYLVDLATNVLIYIMLGWGLNIVVGLAGLLEPRLCRVLRRRGLWLRLVRAMVPT